MSNEILRVMDFLNLNAMETHRHLSNVMDMTSAFLEAIEQRMGATMTEAYKTAVINASMLHDIGKATIPEPILYKRGQLNESERMIIETHPITGMYLMKRIIERMDTMKSSTEEEKDIIANVIYYHHERWDGQGYPSKLQGKQIPLESRIITIVDVFDALTSDRCYKKAWTAEKAVGYLEQEKGKIFDPDLVDCFISMKRERLANVEAG